MTARKAKNNDVSALREIFAALLDAAMADYKNNGGQVSISRDNIKLCGVASVSLLPFITCPDVCRGACAGKCYAAKIAALRPSVRAAYARNTAIFLTDPAAYFGAIRYFSAGVRYFRWHVSGDIPGGDIGRDYFARMVDIARACPACNFLAFTKRCGIVNDWIAANGGTAAALPVNLHVIFSNWGAAFKSVNPYGLPVSEVVFTGEAPADDWKLCGGNCYDCACRGVGCWELKPGETIAFLEH